ncbi:MAG TPA: hypothetical protein VGC64_05950 [Pyrinomonadaceae bacterium]|jgi:hypothetical protein
MEISSLMFALGLLSAGIWLIFTINGEFKGKQRREQRFPPTLHGNQPLARQTQTARRTALSRPAAPPVPAVKTEPLADKQQSASDKWETLDAAVVYERFEKLTRE